MKNARTTLIAAAIAGTLVTRSPAGIANADDAGLDPNAAAGPDAVGFDPNLPPAPDAAPVDTPPAPEDAGFDPNPPPAAGPGLPVPACGGSASRARGLQRELGRDRAVRVRWKLVDQHR